MLEKLRSAASGAYAMVYPNQSNPPNGSSYRHASIERFSLRVRPDVQDAKASSTGVHIRAGTSDSANNHKKMQQQPRGTSRSTDREEDLVAGFQTALTECEQELEKQRAGYQKLISQAETVAEQNSYLEQLNEFLNTLIFKYLEQHAKKNGLQSNKWSYENILAVIEHLSKEAEDAHSYAADAKSLEEQVRTLQKEMLAKVEKVHVASDDQFAQDFRVIISLIKTLSRTIRIGDSGDVAEGLGSGALLEDVSRHLWNSRARKKLLVEAWVWSVLIDMVFITPFVIYGEQCGILNAVWQSIFQAKHYNGWPTPTSLSETWRYTTVESMLGQVGRDVITLGKMTDMPKKLEPGIIGARNSVVNAVGSGLTKISSAAVNPPQVQKIIDKAFAFALQMSLQRVRLQITYPKVGDKFNTDTMTFIHDPDGEDIDDGVVAFIVNPGLTKWGDAHGKNLDHRYDIVPSLVQLEAIPQQKAVETKSESQAWANVAKRGHDGASVSKADYSNEGESQR
ncbi:hypothetical protein EJ02DRAFT_501209 [Clathrospora elynae]|uniref:Uncharacterized protein n=1 Tax=Clathrospora elynae TaxID=706981 RepID=A0A6A5SYJ6_9PLEO|nr:hypothetical protein EJ02DRAFT_501209 [Clathrospora elynae]